MSFVTAPGAILEGTFEVGYGRGKHTPAGSADGPTTASALEMPDGRSKRIHSKMLINALVYAVSDKFDVPDLKNLAQEQFQKALSLGSWPYYEFPSVVTQILRSTPANDKGLRRIAVELCSKHLSEALGNSNTEDFDHDDWEAVLKEDTDFLFDILRYRSRTHISEIKTRDDREGELQANIKNKDAHERELQHMIKYTEFQLRELQKMYENAMDEIVRKAQCSTCPHCKSAFQPAFERLSKLGHFGVSCRQCWFVID